MTFYAKETEELLFWRYFHKIWLTFALDLIVNLKSEIMSRLHIFYQSDHVSLMFNQLFGYTWTQPFCVNSFILYVNVCFLILEYNNIYLIFFLKCCNFNIIVQPVLNIIIYISVVNIPFSMNLWNTEQWMRCHSKTFWTSFWHSTLTFPKIMFFLLKIAIN